MTTFLARRLGTAVLVLFLLSLLVFGMVRLMPGDPAAQYLDTTNPDPAQLEAIRAQLGLDVPWYQQYLDWIGGVLHGSFGTSLTRPFEIGAQIADRLPASLQLAVVASVLAVAVGVPAGVLAAVRTGRPSDTTVRAVSFLALSVPAFVIGTIVVMVNSRTLRLDLIGYTPFSEDPAASLAHMLVPALVLSLPMAGTLSRYTRNMVIDVLSQDFVRTGRAKGAPTGYLVRRHAVRSALVPVTTVIGIQLGTLVGGTIIVENIFAIPGMGSLLIEALNSSDYPTIQACVLVLGAVYIAINLVVDLLYPVIDPRIRTVS
ncbi:ABC transporter permease [Isoptericola sp. NPDC019482]|uniref:ABC transporter permease n=1 Tax=Isoptericola sp. NPDC019482 TaxID=3154688 RepID=UPI003490CDD9